MAPAVALACPTEPEESDSLLWTLSGGLSPPPVLGAGAAMATSNRCACPPLPLRPPSLLLIPRLLAERAVSHAFAGRAGRHARDPRSPRTPRTPSVAARAPLHHCPRGSWLVRRCWVVVAARALIGCPHVGAGWCTRGTMFAHVEPQNMYAHDSFKCCRYQVVVWGVCGAMGARERAITRV